MTAKFYSKDGIENSIEFKPDNEELFIFLKDENCEIISIVLSKKNAQDLVIFLRGSFDIIPQV